MKGALNRGSYMSVPLAADIYRGSYMSVHVKRVEAKR